MLFGAYVSKCEYSISNMLLSEKLCSVGNIHPYAAEAVAAVASHEATNLRKKRLQDEGIMHTKTRSRLRTGARLFWGKEIKTY